MLKERLKNVLNDMNRENYIWKSKKIKDGDGFKQMSTRMMDATKEQLMEWYKYCDMMLDNPDDENPGRRVVIKILKEQRKKCLAELFIRTLEDSTINKSNFLSTVKEFVSKNNIDINEDTKISVAVNVPSWAEDIPYVYVVDACMDKLGLYKRIALTTKFICDRGLWFAPDEISLLTEKAENGTTKDKLQVVRERLFIKPEFNLYVNPKGLNYTQFRGMMKLRDTKYSDMSTIQLETLANRIIFELEDEVTYHISQWEKRKKQIVEVADYKDIVLI